MTKLFMLGFRMLLVASTCTCATSLCRGDDLPAAIFGERSDTPLAAPLGGCDVYPIALYPDPNAQARAEAELQNLKPGAEMIWHAARGTFWFVTLSVPLPQCVGQTDVFAQLFKLTRRNPGLFQLDLAEWTMPAKYACSRVGAGAKVLEIKRARVGSHPIAHDVMRFTVQRVNGVVELTALFGEYLPPATPSLDAKLSACPELNNQLARQVVLDSLLPYSIFDTCFYLGSGQYSPNGLDTIAFAPVARWAWHEDPIYPRVFFTKSSQGSLLLDPSNHTPDLIRSDANCPDENGPEIGFRLTLDTVKTELVSSQPGLDCVVCLR